MKMSAEHYAVLKEKVVKVVPDLPAHKQRLTADPKVKDVAVRLIWDTFHAARIFNTYTYQEFDYTDAHIATAMRRIFKELGVAL